MSDESTSGLATPNLVGDAGGWDDEPSNTPAEGQNEPKEALDSPEGTKPKAAIQPTPEAKPAAPKKAPEFVELDGKKLTMDELKRELEKAKGADKRFREAADKEKWVNGFIERLQSDPLSVLKDKRLSINQRELAEKLLLESLQDEMLTPDQRKLREYEEQLKSFTEREQAVKREQEERETEQRREIKRQELTEMFTKAMDSSPLSKDPETAAIAMRDMAMMLRAAKERGIEVSAEELAKAAEAKYQKAMYALANTLEGEDLIGFLGEAVVKKIRKADLARLKSNAPQHQSHKDEDWQAPKSKGESTRIDPRSARDHARKLLFGK